jgi:hypothetical protein
MKQKTTEFVPKVVLSKEILSIWYRRADSGPNRNNLFSIREIREQYQNVLVLFPKQYRNVCPFVLTLLLPGTKLWMPYIKRDETENNTLANFYTGQSLGRAGIVPWRQGEPSRPEASCVRCNRDDCAVKPCTNTATFLCHIAVMWVGRPLLHLRGLCAETALDTFYYPQLMPQEAADSSGGLGSPVLVWTGLSGIVGDP